MKNSNLKLRNSHNEFKEKESQIQYNGEIIATIIEK